MFLLVGLGNPGVKYEKTRHNVGFLFLDYFYNKSKGETFYEESNYISSDINIRKNKFKLIKPTTYMNLSGEAVKKAVGKIKAKYEDFDISSNLIVVHDDVDLTLGQIKIKKDGGDGGHNGIKDIIDKLGDNFIRVRIGIGKDLDTTKHVLSDFSKAEWDLIWEDCFPRAYRFINEYISIGFLKAQNRLNFPLINK